MFSLLSLANQQITVPKLNSLLLFLFLGASVAFAELPFEHPDFVEFFSEEGHEEILGELADEENDPHHQCYSSGFRGKRSIRHVISLPTLVIVTFRKPLL